MKNGILVSKEKYKLISKEFWSMDGTFSFRDICVLHRIDGPAVLHHDDSTSWFVNGTEYHSNKEYQKATRLTDEEMTLIILKYGSIA